MPIIAYRNYRPTAAAVDVINKANALIAEYQADGLTLTLRQLYYRFVANGWIENKHAEYRRLGAMVTAAREGGLMDWYAIEDRGRNCFYSTYQTTPEEVLKGIERALGLDPWLDQDTYLEVWVEKDALQTVVARPAARRRVPYMACKGYLSASEAWRAGLRFEKAIRRGKRPVLLHLGDHDPSGMDMTRDNRERLAMFARRGVEVNRLALNMDQVEEYSPPPNYAKTTDSRFETYKGDHGDLSWELDALEPRTIDRIIREAIEGYIDEDKWKASLEKEKEARLPLLRLQQRWGDEVAKLVMSHERPLERLAAMDSVLLEHVPVPDMLEQFANRVEELPVEVSVQMQAGAVSRVEAVEEPGRDQSPDHIAGFDQGKGQALDAVREMPTFDKALPEDAAWATMAQDRATRLHEAMEPIPFVAPDVSPDNEYEPEDPEEHELDERFGEED